MKAFHIKRTSSSRAYEFLKNKQFTDCILKDGNNAYDAHRLILSMRSEWFKSYFKKHTQNDSNCQVPLPFNTENVIKIIIDFIYNQVINFDKKNIIPIIKASDVYGIKDLKEQAVSYIRKEIPKLPDHSFLNIVRDFVNFDIDDSFIQQNENIERLATLLANTDINQRKNQIFDSISPSILARILKSQKFNDSKDKIDRLSMIDEFTNFYIAKKMEQKREKSKQDQDKSSLPNIYSILTNEEKSVFENVFKWGQTDYKRFLRYRCDWVTDSTSRDCINSIINNRRRIISNFEEELKNCKNLSESCRWYPFNWISAISNSVLTTESPEVNAISLLNTLDNFVDNKHALNPGKYGFINVESTPEMNVHFNRFNAVWVNDSFYYLSKSFVTESLGSSDEEPFYSFDFGNNAHFEVSKLEIESNLSRCKDGKRQFPESVKIEGITSENQIAKPVYQKVDYDKGGKCSAQIHFESPISQIKVSMVGEENNGGNLLRIKFIDVKGHFVH